MRSLVKIVPRIVCDPGHPLHRSRPSASALPGQEPSIFPKLVREQLCEDLWVSYVMVVGDHRTWVQQSFLEANPLLTLGDLNTYALQALTQAIEQPIKIIRFTQSMVMVTCGSELESSLILLDRFWELIHQTMAGEVRFVIPTTDTLLVYSADDERATQRVVDLVTQSFQKPHAQNLLSTGVYQKSPGQTTIRLVGPAR